MYVVIEPRLNKFLAELSQNEIFCKNVPEIDVIFKDQLDIYLSPADNIKSKTSSLESQVSLALRKNTDGSFSYDSFKTLMPTAMYLNGNAMFMEMFGGVNAIVILYLFMLAAIVIYSLMISDVNEQTY